MIAGSDQFTFDEKAANHVCEFFGLLPHIKGRHAGKFFKLEKWQENIIRPLFGWKRQDGTRRYRTAYIEVPRKNGKSFLCSAIALYLLFCDKEEGAEIYSVAGTRDQALMVFDPACAMIHETKLAGACQIYKSQKRVVYKNSFYRAVAAEAGQIHGTNPHGIIFDELHVQPDRELWDTFQTGRGARTQPLTVAITTAGYDRSSICWEIHEYARRVADPNDPLEDDSFLSVIYGADAEDDWTDPATWAKANPNLGVSIFPEFLQEECEKAKDSPAYENTFRRLYLNQWTEQSVRWLPMVAWDECGAVTVSEDELIGRPCFGGLDIGNTRDVTAMVLVFPMDDGRYVLRPTFWIPKDAHNSRAEQDRRQIKNWASSGFVRETEGNVADLDGQIPEDIFTETSKFRLQSMGFDPWQAEPVRQKLVNRGMPESVFMEFRQTIGNFASPTKELERLVASRKLVHNRNPVLRWMASNVTVKTDTSGNIRPDKEKSADKIDGVVAAIMGIAMATTETSSVYTKRGAISIGGDEGETYQDDFEEEDAYSHWS